MASETANCEREDGREDAGFEKQDEGEYGHAGFAFDAYGECDEDYDSSHESEKDKTGTQNHHEACGGETSDGEEALADYVAV